MVLHLKRRWACGKLHMHGGGAFTWDLGGFCEHKLVPFSIQQLHFNLVIILA